MRIDLRLQRPHLIFLFFDLASVYFIDRCIQTLRHTVITIDQITDLIRTVILNLHTKIPGFQITHFLLKLTDTFRYELGNYTDTCDCCDQTDQDCCCSNY